MKWLQRSVLVIFAATVVLFWTYWQSPLENTDGSLSISVRRPGSLNFIHKGDYKFIKDVSCNFTTTKTDPPYKICIHDTTKDIVISTSLVRAGVWERKYIHNFKTLLGQYGKMWFLDVGANIGPYSLLAAAMGYHVVSVEPTAKNLNLLKRSVIINGFQERVTIVTNALSDNYRNYSSKDNNNNPGGIAMMNYTGTGRPIKSVPMSDLSVLIPKNAAVLIKMDCEGCEESAIAGAEGLLSHVYVPYIMMEWQNHKRKLRFLHTMTSHNYTSYSHDGHVIDMANTRLVDVIWIHKDAKKPDNLHIPKRS